MKWLALLLALLNLGFFLWQVNNEPTGHRTAWQPEAAVGEKQLLLLREMDPALIKMIPPPSAGPDNPISEELPSRE